jgi:hypothetical protein
MLSKATSLTAIGLAAGLFALGQPLRAAAQGTTKFDGSWEVTLDAKAYKNADGSTAQPWVIHFAAMVKNGVLHGEHGTRGQPSFYELSGKIEAVGTANLRIDEITGAQKYNFSNTQKGPAGKGVPYSYQVSAHFDEKHGTGKSTGDSRTRVFTFVKQG